jgi:catechol 2,3-dioxygenase-like lactoylglutathione lyase family enzyme
MAHPSPRTARLGALVGRWRTEGVVLGDAPVAVIGTDTYEWLPGRHFLVHHVDVTVGDRPVRAIELIGDTDPATDELTATAYGDDGAVTVMRSGVGESGVWTFTGGGDVASAAYDGDVPPPAAVVRSTLRLAGDGRSMTALWERADDGVHWVPWMDMRFARIDPAVRQLRVVVEAVDLDEALAFYRDALGLTEQAAFSGDGDARVAILEAGRATLELANPAQRRLIDDVEVGHDTGPRPRLAFEVDDTRAVTSRLTRAGATVVGEPVETPWRSLNARLDGPEGLQLTLFQELEPLDERRRRPGFGTTTG